MKVTKRAMSGDLDGRSLTVSMLTWNVKAEVEGVLLDGKAKIGAGLIIIS